MKTPEELRKERFSYAIILRGLLRDIEKSPDSVFFLMEGKDGEYYRPRISALMAGFEFPSSFRNCHGKKNMKPLLIAVMSNDVTKGARILFFFDRDYENDLAEIEHHQCYVTDGYSIENHYTSVEAFSDIVSDAIFIDKINSDDDQSDLEAVIKIYQNLQIEFHTKIALFNYWAWHQRHFPSEGALNLDNFSVSDHFTICEDMKSVNASYLLADLNAMSPDRKPVEQQNIEVAKNWFEGRSPQLVFRGKQERDFLYRCLSDLIEKSSKGLPPFSTVRKCRKRVSRQELIGDLSASASTPQSLTSFLRRHREIWEEDINMHQGMQENSYSGQSTQLDS